MQMHYQTAPNIKYGVILPVVISWYLSKIYQSVYFDLLKNMLGKLNPIAFFPFCYTIRELWRKKKYIYVRTYDRILKVKLFLNIKMKILKRSIWKKFFNWDSFHAGQKIHNKAWS